ncbi:hypothetical protein [Deinococcus multiflagellatus]|uniref:Lipoprotein n=1 Tax=Deinococcus multiflagellatus TaxID=1656887 RepID=A0ABW1ZFM5_9DEIO|nr:hypothetical protein [Deinococcus multiflagellatus]MBZ9711870.1 hypothetical protein [Deinococcus multiflagellatus]
MPRPACAPLLSLLLLSSCAPTIQTGTGPVRVVGNVVAAASPHVSGDTLRDADLAAVAPGTYVTFSACQLSGVPIEDVRAAGLAAARAACAASLGQLWGGVTVLSVLALPLVAVVVWFFVQLLKLMTFSA